MNEQAGWGWRPVKRKWTIPSPADPVISGDDEGRFGVVGYYGFHSTSEFSETHIKRGWVAKDFVKRQPFKWRLFFGKTKKTHQTGKFFLGRVQFSLQKANQLSAVTSFSVRTLTKRRVHFVLDTCCVVDCYGEAGRPKRPQIVIDGHHNTPEQRD